MTYCVGVNTSNSGKVCEKPVLDFRLGQGILAFPVLPAPCVLCVQVYCSTAKLYRTVTPRPPPASQCACVNSDTSLLFLLVRLSSACAVFCFLSYRIKSNHSNAIIYYASPSHEVLLFRAEQWMDNLLHTILYLDYR